MALATIINMVVFVCVPAWGSWVPFLAWALWWLDVAIAIATNFYLPFIIMQKHKALPRSRFAAARALTSV